MTQNVSNVTWSSSDRQSARQSKSTENATLYFRIRFVFHCLSVSDGGRWTRTRSRCGYVMQKTKPLINVRSQHTKCISKHKHMQCCGLIHTTVDYRTSHTHYKIIICFCQRKYTKTRKGCGQYLYARRTWRKYYGSSLEIYGCAANESVLFGRWRTSINDKRLQQRQQWTTNDTYFMRGIGPE